MRRMNSQGYTVIELMIVVAIIGILAAIVYPNYQDYIRKARRSDGSTALQSLQMAQQTFRSSCRWFAGQIDTVGGDSSGTDDCNASAALSDIDVRSYSEENYYTIDITAGSASGTGYIATATAVGGQTTDVAGNVSCAILTLTVSGDEPNGARTPTDCW
jgi:type IV pilus assembly protein PilE